MKKVTLISIFINFNNLALKSKFLYLRLKHYLIKDFYTVLLIYEHAVVM